MNEPISRRQSALGMATALAVTASHADFGAAEETHAQPGERLISEPIRRDGNLPVNLNTPAFG